MSIHAERTADSMLAETHMALIDIQGICELVRGEQSIDQADFPAPVAAAIRMIQMRAEAAMQIIETETRS